MRNLLKHCGVDRLVEIHNAFQVHLFDEYILKRIEALVHIVKLYFELQLVEHGERLRSIGGAADHLRHGVPHLADLLLELLVLLF